MGMFIFCIFIWNPIHLVYGGIYSSGFLPNADIGVYAVRRYRYILTLAPISALISMIPDIGVHRYRRLPDIGYTRYRVNADIGVCRYRHHIRIYRYRRLPISAFTDIGYTRYRIYTDIGTIPPWHNIPILAYIRRYRFIFVSDIVSHIPMS